jgi:arylsulfatase A-like enzyme
MELLSVTTKANQYLRMASSSLLVCPLFLSAQNQEKRPNVILIYTDDQGSLDMNCYGATDLYTPNMDALAQKGVRFTQFYAAPVSSPSRASLLTGQFTRHAGLWNNAGGDHFLPSEKTTIAERLKEAGYATGLIGKWHLGDQPEVSPNAQGFDYFFGHKVGCLDNYSHFFYWSGPNKHDLWRNDHEVFYNGQFLPDLSVREIKNFIHDNKDHPFFLYWATNLPHYPLQGDTRWNEYYRHLPYPRNLYAAFISTLDERLGEVLSYLENNGLSENTIIILQSDNGHSVEQRNHNGGGYCGNYRGAKFSLFEGGIRIPAIISFPAKLPQGQVRDQLAMNIDWFPTVLELCGLPNSGLDLDGKSLVPIIRDEKKASAHDILHFDAGQQWAVRKGDWKLIGDIEDPVKPKSINKRDTLFLSNLKIDITEANNLAGNYPKIVDELKKDRDAYLQKQENKKSKK